jgi:hypothetical protein
MILGKNGTLRLAIEWFDLRSTNGKRYHGHRILF